MPPHNAYSVPNRSNQLTKNEKSHDISSTSQSAIPNKVLKTPGLVTLDGRTLEGGGQLVRVALTLSALLSIPVHIHHIRGKRAPRGRSGGLKESHLAALEFLQSACGAEAYGAEVGGTEIAFLPGKDYGRSGTAISSMGGRHVIELKNPGSVWLILQAIYPCLLFHGGNGTDADGSTKPVKLTIRGGTNVSMSMSAEYVQQVFLPIMEKIGLPETEIIIQKRGWTHGKLEVGQVEASVTPLNLGQSLEGFSIGDINEGTRRNPVTKIMISVMASPTAVLEHLAMVAQEKVRTQFPDAEKVEVLVQENSGDPRRMYLLLVAHLHDGWRVGRDWLFDGKLKNNDTLAITKQMVEKVVNDLSA